MASEDVGDVEADFVENEIYGGEDGGQENLFRKKPRKKTSEVWKEMKEVTNHGVVKVQCNHCKEYFAKGKSGATMQHKRHLENCLQRKINLTEKNKQSGQSQQLLSFSETTPPQMIVKISHELFNEYAVAYNSSNEGKEKGGGKRGRETWNSSSGGGDNDMFGHKVLSGKEKFHMLMSKVDKSSTQRSELDMYLDEHRYNCDVDAHLDVLDWWKGQKHRFPILSKMASDILSIPITSVASESTFSAGGRVVDEHRASLAVETVEMLLCGRDWVRCLHGLKKKARNQEEDQLSKAFERIELPDDV